MRLFQYISNIITDFIYPPVCFLCNEKLSEPHLKVCPVCWSSFTLINAMNSTLLELKSKFNSEGKVEDVISCYLFEKEGKLQEVIHLLKYRGMKSLGVKLGEELGKVIIRNQKFSNADFIIPIPLHKLKKRERGYNQSEFICKGISSITNIPVNTDIVHRVKYTKSQTQLNLVERRENVADAFFISEKKRKLVAGKKVIIVDDVITTGSTINSCANELIKANAGTTLAASVAIAQ